MVIKKIKILKNKVKVTLDDGNVLEIAKDVYPNFYLYEGKSLSRKELKEINDYNNAVHLLQYALKIREKNLYSEYKMREKLYEKGGNKEQVDKVIKILKSHDLIDDKALLEDYIEYYNSLNYGKQKIINKLLDKGIFMEKIEKVHFPLNVERKKANNLLPKLENKYAKYNNEQKKNHIFQAYLTQGFDVEIAKEMVDKIKLTPSKEEYKKLERDFEKIYYKYQKKYEKKELRLKIMNHLCMKGYKMNDVINLLERKIH